jgi:hypothetical protein
MRRFLIATMVAWTVAWTVIVMGCASKGPFRQVQKQDGCFPNTGADPVPAGDGKARPAPSIDCRHVLFSTGFVEFQANGTLVDPAQANKAMALIREKKQSGPDRKIITVVYVHGWKNNAARTRPGGKAKDVEKFQSALQELGYRARAAANALPFGHEFRRTPVPIVGIYVGWPGKSLMGPNWFTFLSYWSRRGTANRVGDGEGLGPLLTSVIAETRKDSPKSRVILVGHSFGARVLEHAIENRDVALYDEKAEGPVDPFVDLVLYVNSANDARLTVSKVIDLQKKPITLRHPDYSPELCDPVRDKMRGAARRAAAGPAAPESDASKDAPTPRQMAECRDYPLVVAITSRGDDATKRLQPVANAFSDGSPKLQPLNLPSTFADPTPSESAFSRAAAAHMPFLQSHVVMEAACRDRVEDPECPAGDLQCRFAFRTHAARATCFQVMERTGVAATAAEPAIPASNGRAGRRELPAQAAKPPFNKTAFWIMDVDKVVIADHGDIWNQSFVEMLGQLMAPRNFFETDKPPLRLLKERPATPAITDRP